MTDSPVAALELPYLDQAAEFLPDLASWQRLPPDQALAYYKELAAQAQQNTVLGTQGAALTAGNRQRTRMIAEAANQAYQQAHSEAHGGLSADRAEDEPLPGLGERLERVDALVRQRAEVDDPLVAAQVHIPVPPADHAALNGLPDEHVHGIIDQDTLTVRMLAAAAGTLDGALELYDELGLSTPTPTVGSLPDIPSASASSFPLFVGLDQTPFEEILRAHIESDMGETHAGDSWLTQEWTDHDPKAALALYEQARAELIAQTPHLHSDHPKLAHRALGIAKHTYQTALHNFEQVTEQAGLSEALAALECKAGLRDPVPGSMDEGQELRFGDEIHAERIKHIGVPPLTPDLIKSLPPDELDAYSMHAQLVGLRAAAQDVYTTLGLAQTPNYIGSLEDIPDASSDLPLPIAPQLSIRDDTGMPTVEHMIEAIAHQTNDAPMIDTSQPFAMHI